MINLISRTSLSTCLIFCIDYIPLMINWEYSQVENPRPISEHMQSSLAELLGMDHTCLSLWTGATAHEIGDPESDSFL